MTWIEKFPSLRKDLSILVYPKLLRRKQRCMIHIAPPSHTTVLGCTLQLWIIYYILCKNTTRCATSYIAAILIKNTQMQAYKNVQNIA